MPNKMLIDASHPEETRVVVTRGNRIEEFDFESQDKKQLKGNIYLARVTRVEPSLQAAFVEYGGNRHGFLAFSEIHPDYYQIPVADRQALLKAEAEAAEAEEAEADEAEERAERGRGRRRKGGRERGRASDRPQASAEGDSGENGDAETPEAMAERVSSDSVSEEADLGAEEHDGDDRSESSDDDHDDNDRGDDRNGGRSDHRGSANGNGDDSEIEVVGSGDAMEEVQTRRKPVRRHYKIQEVIKRRQILLVQVVKEERGNKGAALTTYLSLAGRYSVLMPNTARGGGISRKITNVQDRKRLKEVVRDLEVPQGMGVILRTAGESRTKAEIKRDYEYLMRMWENVRNLTLQSTAPALVYEEGSLIKRSVRDLYNKDIDEILVAGEEGYREAKDFMRMLMPSHAKMVQPYRDNVPIFARNGIEAQLDKMLHPQVTLKSGGYIIINQTEALVAIDVNSGRSTREHSIEDTALQTNLEAAEEVARQLRLRDMAGLIVIDFIDMEENRNNRAVEKKVKDCLKNDRARIQVGRISHFGLLEMSRQRIRASVLESTMQTCPHCGGTGHIRSESSVALHVVRAIEEFLLKDSRHHITVRTPVQTALYVLNNKRRNLADLEARFGLTITVEGDESVGSQHYAISKGAIAEKPEHLLVPQAPEPVIEVEDDDVEPIAFDDEPESLVEEVKPRDSREPREAREPRESREATDGDGRDKKRRRRRRRRGRDRDRDGVQGEAGSGDTESSDEAVASDVDDSDESVTQGEPREAATASDEGEKRKRRRGKRGGRRNKRDEDGSEGVAGEASEASADGQFETVEGADETGQTDEPVSSEAVMSEASENTDAPATDAASDVAQPEVAEKPKRRSRAKAVTGSNTAAEPAEKAPRKRASRKKADVAEQPAVVAEDASTTEPVATATPAPAPEPEPTVEDVPAPSRRAAAPATSGEPKLSSTVAEEAKPADGPKKGGWWQRKSFF